VVVPSSRNGAAISTVYLQEQQKYSTIKPSKKNSIVSAKKEAGRRRVYVYK
jgi:hypothetical protein